MQGADIYRSLHTYLSEHCKDIKEVSCSSRRHWETADTQPRQESEKLSDLDLLKVYAKQWDQYTRGADYVNKLFNYLNKHWVRREKDEGRKEVYTVYTVDLSCLRSSKP